jgi:ClpP class serine protease
MQALQDQAFDLLVQRTERGRGTSRKAVQTAGQRVIYFGKNGRHGAGFVSEK